MRVLCDKFCVLDVIFSRPTNDGRTRAVDTSALVTYFDKERIDFVSAKIDAPEDAISTMMVSLMEGSSSQVYVVLSDVKKLEGTGTYTAKVPKEMEFNGECIVPKGVLTHMNFMKQKKYKKYRV